MSRLRAWFSDIRHPKTTIAITFVLVMTTIPEYPQLGSEFMPPLNEGTILYMPTTLPGISVAESQRILQLRDRVLRSIPEVERVFGKAGRAESSTDPAPFRVRAIPGTSSICAVRTAGGYFLDFDLKRDQLARYGLSVSDAQNVIMSAVGVET